jgi:hypothetical protein
MESGLYAQTAATPAPAPAATPEVDFDRQGAPATPQARDSESLLNDLFSEERSQGSAAPVPAAAPAAVPLATPVQGPVPVVAPPPVPQAPLVAGPSDLQGTPPPDGQSLYTPAGVASPVSNPAGQGEAVIERSAGGQQAAKPAGSTPVRRTTRRKAQPTFKNNTEARWFYSKSAWITPNQAKSLGCYNSYSESYTLLHLRCIDTLKGFGD